MHLKKQDMIKRVMQAFNSEKYCSAIDKRLCYGLYNNPLDKSEIDELNMIINCLDNPMLSGYYFYLYMDEEMFDKVMSHLLYVAGRWESLSHYNVLIFFSIKECSFYFSDYDTSMEVIYSSSLGETKVNIDDQKIGINIKHIITINREF